jgi:3',5'-cyclic-AMP phosphodiesterase
VVEGAQANWLILDSLDQTDVTPGKLGEAQLGWVDRTLRDLPERPVIAFVHHNPQMPVEDGKKKGGLLDTDALLALFEKHRKVKALVFGHTHNWSVQTDAKTGLHLINLPPVGYAHKPDRPVGWVDVALSADGVNLELRSLEPAHSEHGQRHELKWRA